MTDVAMKVRKLGHAYRKNEWLFHDLTFDVPRGSVTAVLGPNGSGKSTLLHTLLNLLEPTAGGVEVQGKTAYVPQLFGSAFAFSALDMVLMGRAARLGPWSQPTRHDEALALEAMGQFGISGLADRSFDLLSGGERQLVTLARATLTEADILVLDEPCAVLDLKHQFDLLDWLGKLADERGFTIVFSTHDPQHAMSIADDAALLVAPDDCRIGPVHQVLTTGNLHDLYGIDVRVMSSTSASGDRVEYVIPTMPRRRPVV